MADLSHWDFAEHFYGYDAAALILGLEPRESADDQWRIKVVIDRMELHYQHAVSRIFHATSGDPIENVLGHEPYRVDLLSVKLHDLEHRAVFFNDETILSEWLGSERLIAFENQMFERNAIGRWLSRIDLGSIYSFERQMPLPKKKTDGYWPWGNHDTKLLGHLDAAALEFWVNYDPRNAKVSAPKNETVVNWLETVRGVSGQMAKAIATMLRPDDLPTGPRK